MINTFLLLILIIPLTNCKEEGMCDDKLKIQRVDYVGKLLSINGYYYGDPNSQNNVDIYYLYENGVFFDSGVESLEDAQKASFSIDLSNEFLKKVKGAWGVFLINNGTIEIERWQSALNGCENTIYERGDVLNDTTFVITHREFRKNGNTTKTVEPNSEFHFRPLPQKPDSTNSFIE